jgi:hypothetical protein
MRLFLVGLMLGLFALDIVIDSYDFACPGSHASVSCCADACGAHVVPQRIVLVELVPVRAEFIAHELVLHASPPPQSLLRPPCLAA